MAKVLFLGGGRRVELARLFFEAGHDVYAYELESNTPISENFFIIDGLPWSDSYCKTNIKDLASGMDLVVPLQDEATLLLSELGLSNGVAPSYETASICFDKSKFQNFMLANFTKYYPLYQLGDSYIVKPRFGFGSRDLKFGDYHPDFEPQESIIQKFIKGKEYSVDAYFDKLGRYVDSVPRERIRVAGGEVISSLTVEYSYLQDLTRTIGEKLGLIGPVNLQFIVENMSPYLIEVNSRFGGGSTLSIKAGLDMISLIGNDWLGINYEYVPNIWDRNLRLERSYRDHFFYENSY